MRWSLVAAASCWLLACASEAATPPSNDQPAFAAGASRTTPGGPPPAAAADGPEPESPPAAPPKPEPDDADVEVDPSPSSHPEVVHVLARGGGGTGFCTGALVAPDLVVTAAHCLKSPFSSWTVGAPGASGHPKVRASYAAMYAEAWWDPAHPDLGILKLASSIRLARYAELTDVTGRVEAGKPTAAVAVVRTRVSPEAPFHKRGPMVLSSAADLGYKHGFSVPLFSAGGDSGAAMFLVDRGEVTHKIVAVVREPEPDRAIDHSSRVDAAFASWVDEHR